MTEKISDVLINIDARISNFEKQRAWLVDNSKWLDKCPFPIESLEAGSRRIIVRNLAELDKARAFLKKSLGQWEDKHDNTFYSFEAIATFISENNPGICIWLKCPLDDFPQELLGENCKWEETEIKDYNVVCAAK